MMALLKQFERSGREKNGRCFLKKKKSLVNVYGAEGKQATYDGAAFIAGGGLPGTDVYWPRGDLDL